MTLPFYRYKVRDNIELQKLTPTSQAVGELVLVSDTSTIWVLMSVSPIRWAIYYTFKEEEMTPIPFKHTALDWISMWREEFEDGVYKRDPSRANMIPSRDAITPPSYSVSWVSSTHVRYSSNIITHSLYGPYMFEIDKSYHKAVYKVFNNWCTEEAFMPMYWARRLKNKEKLEELLGMFLASHSKEIV